jgi:hypothetical protein
MSPPWRYLEELGKLRGSLTTSPRRLAASKESLSLHILHMAWLSHGYPKPRSPGNEEGGPDQDHTALRRPETTMTVDGRSAAMKARRR